MQEQNCAVCVAINDNHRAWYEMLLPFILSIRKTDFNGRFFVLSYGLSSLKRTLLEANGITVWEAVDPIGLPIGRYIEAARLLEHHPDVEKLALYDADIWFCNPRFDLFEQVSGDRIHATTDPLFCHFVIAPLIGDNREALTQSVVTEVMARHGGALQAGLTAGTRAAWANFAVHIQQCMKRIGTDFQDCFGIDTTFLHLWAAEDGVSLLSETQNFISKRGLEEVFDGQTGQTHFIRLGERIRAIHMSGDIRFFNRWRYYANNPDHAFAHGEALALAPSHHLQEIEISDEAAAATRTLGLTLSAVRTEPYPGAHVQHVNTPSNLTWFGVGNHEIQMTATEDIARLDVYMSFPSGFPSPVRWVIDVDGKTMVNSNQLMSHQPISLQAGSRVVLRSQSLGGQLCKALWMLSTTPEIQQ